MERLYTITNDTYELLTEQIQQCIFPQLDRDIGDEPLDRSDFYTFVHGFNVNMELLFDAIAQKEHLLFEPHAGRDNRFRINFTLVAQQQTHSFHSPFQTYSQRILKQLTHLQDKYYKKIWSQAEVRRECMAYYKKSITAEKWKSNIGAVVGCANMYVLHRKYIKTAISDPDELMFMVSVGMLLLDFHQAAYKTIGLSMFELILELGDPNKLNDLNIPNVIYKRLMHPLFIVCKDEPNTTLILQCLTKCLKSFNKWQKPTIWNEIDDVLGETIKRLAFEKECRNRMLLILFMARITTLPIDTIETIQNATNVINMRQHKLLDEGTFDELRNVTGTYHNLLVARWTKKLMEYFKQQIIVGTPQEIKQQLNVLHVCYLCCLYGNPLIIKPGFLDFWDSVTVNMLHLMRSNNNSDIFVEEIQSILKTFTMHIERFCASIGENPEIEGKIGAFQSQLEILQGKFEELFIGIKNE